MYLQNLASIPPRTSRSKFADTKHFHPLLLGHKYRSAHLLPSCYQLNPSSRLRLPKLLAFFRSPISFILLRSEGLGDFVGMTHISFILVCHDRPSGPKRGRAYVCSNFSPNLNILDNNHLGNFAWPVLDCIDADCCKLLSKYQILNP